MHITKRVEGIAESATLSVARRARDLAAAGVDVIDLSVGEPDFDSPPEAVAAAQQALGDGFTRYTANSGILALRRGLTDSYRSRYGSPWSPDHVMVTVGAKMALFELALALCEPGDEVILPAPYWTTYPEAITL
ncbi:MAG: aminotransferase class I/II-fold pyridoxal phosphate-dependent enzyme, partial [Acidobacteria bacterium]|nr:aminotransferase class I/II-fold pyridoxal phosphate-dependent enzyme [Acidobacteriota bacterium]